MLDTDTKRRIDTARDILVGKVPDPKSQVEQITIALIYKFMDDMDADADELGGKRSFFAGAYARYGWSKLMAPGLGGHEMLNLYAEGITKMPENPGIPPLFREMFKNAYLPYRDPETLKAFLKIIDEFQYDNSERLGDAFEYLLSVLGSQGDAGQFRTPRHIIDFIVAIVDPKKNETVLDPACGTAGFLISSYKHILKANTDAKGHNTLTPDQRARLVTNFKGYDISPDMVRLSLVNLYLHGFADPHIFEYDTLTSLERWGEYADVILANPPFMSPKGGIKPHNRFGMQSKRSEVLFVDYMAEHLTPNGRAAIIVPEGIIFQSQNAYKQLRKLLVEEYLVAVISLPAGVFNPYSGVKTSILILDKALAKQADSIAFFKVDNDGFNLGAQRRAVDKNDLPQVLVEVEEFLRRLRARESLEDFQLTLGLIVRKEKLAANGDYNLSGERYRESVASNTSYPLVPVGRFMKEGVKTVDPRRSPGKVFELWSIPAFDSGRPELLGGAEIGSQKKLVEPNDVLLSRIIPHIRRGWVVQENLEGRAQIASTEWIVFSSDKVVPEFLRRLLVSDFFHTSFMQTITGVGGSLSRANPTAVGEIKIPLPPFDVQKEIVLEIDGYQKVIDGARTVLDNYRPHIPIHPDWPINALSEVTAKITDGAHFTPTYTNEGVPFLRVTDITQSNPSKKFIPREEHVELIKRCRPEKGDVLYSKNGTIGIAKLVDWDWEFSIFVSLCLIKVRKDILDSRYLACFLNSRNAYAQAAARSKSGTVTNLHLVDIKTINIPVPSLETQQQVVAEIEAEEALVNANRELITRFEKKIQATLVRVWGEEPNAARGEDEEAA